MVMWLMIKEGFPMALLPVTGEVHKFTDLN
jgi:hypothetical protein